MNFSALQKGIIEKSKELSFKVFFDEAPQEYNSYPYSTYHFLSVAPDRDSGTEYEEGRVQFNIFDNSDSPNKLGEAIKEFDTLFKECQNTLLVEGYSVVNFTRDFIFFLPKKEGNFQVSIQYFFRLQKL